MVTFIYTTDWHLRSLPSQSIDIENYNSIMFSRIETILSRDVDFIIHGGDFFDSYICEDVNFFNKVVDLLYKYKRKIYLVPGNHDLVGYEPKSVSWTSVGTLVSARLVTVLEPGYNTINNVTLFVVYPTKGHDASLYKGLKNCIVITHNLISPKQFPFKVTLTKEILPYVDQCLFLCGDLHHMFVESYDNCAFFNPGPLVRVDSSEYNGSGFFEFMFDPENFSVKFRRNIFPDVPFTVRTFEQETIKFVSKFDNLECSFLSVEKVVETVANRLYPNDPKVKEEALSWIRRMRE